MRPIMFKFNSDRQNKNRIKTVIYKGAEKKYVMKEALTEEAELHIKEIYENYTLLKNIYPEYYICPAEFKKNALCFEFIEGDMFSQKYENAISHAAKEEFVEVLIEQKRLILSCIENNFCLFHPEKEFMDTFGDPTPYLGKKAMKCSDFEFTSHNIIQKRDGKTALVDYEYVFCFPVPVSLILYHCIIKTNMFTIAGFERMLCLDEMMEVLEIENTVDELETSWLYFQNQYSIGLIEKAKTGYLKATNDVTELLEKYYQNEQDIKGHLNYINILTHDLEEQQQYIQILSDEIEKKKAETDELSHEIIEKEKSYTAEKEYYESTIGHQLAEIDELSHEIIEKEKSYTAEKEYYESTISHQLAKAKMKDDEIKNCNYIIQSISDKLCQKDGVISEQTIQIDILQSTNFEIAKSKALLEAEVNMIKNSVSWRITEPFRRVIDLFRSFLYNSNIRNSEKEG